MITYLLENFLKSSMTLKSKASFLGLFLLLLTSLLGLLSIAVIYYNYTHATTISLTDIVSVFQQLLQRTDSLADITTTSNEKVIKVMESDQETIRNSMTQLSNNIDKLNEAANRVNAVNSKVLPVAMDSVGDSLSRNSWVTGSLFAVMSLALVTAGIYLAGMSGKLDILTEAVKDSNIRVADINAQIASNANDFSTSMQGWTDSLAQSFSTSLGGSTSTLMETISIKTSLLTKQLTNLLLQPTHSVSASLHQALAENAVSSATTTTAAVAAASAAAVSGDAGSIVETGQQLGDAFAQSAMDPSGAGSEVAHSVVTSTLEAMKASRSAGSHFLEAAGGPSAKA